MALRKFICAIIARCLFIIVAFLGVFGVTSVKKDPRYWLLTLLFLPLIFEMFLTLKIRKGEDYKWFSPAILLFLISIIPSIWILELYHQENKLNDPQCNSLNLRENVRSILNTTRKKEIIKELGALLSDVCVDDWILALHQILLILLIVGKWLLPKGGSITRDGLSQLLLIFVGIAADILEFTSETLSDVKESRPEFVCVILGVWTWSMLQFPFHVTVVNPRSADATEGRSTSRLRRHFSDIWGITESLLAHDGPFLVVRLLLMIKYRVFHKKLVFFTVKNFLVIILSFYRLYVIMSE
ncbi:transmembrane protein 26-like [Brienomyrus brachyistius]|uniref:transmembrane protein 26-like n=1 Tax=Brienomyrus brachyistius TaxID=42636 RepID=UPI0020B2B0B0|nr:transmembrane protein 26-like [Brienomyrus brachyistius]